jgi:hypothetical protein
MAKIEILNQQKDSSLGYWATNSKHGDTMVLDNSVYMRTSTDQFVRLDDGDLINCIESELGYDASETVLIVATISVNLGAK